MSIEGLSWGHLGPLWSGDGASLPWVLYPSELVVVVGPPVGSLLRLGGGSAPGGVAPRLGPAGVLDPWGVPPGPRPPPAPDLMTRIPLSGRPDSPDARDHVQPTLQVSLSSVSSKRARAARLWELSFFTQRVIYTKHAVKRS